MVHPVHDVSDWITAIRADGRRPPPRALDRGTTTHQIAVSYERGNLVSRYHQPSNRRFQFRNSRNAVLCVASGAGGHAAAVAHSRGGVNPQPLNPQSLNPKP